MIVFIHIPKTAGTTIYEIVKNNHKTFLKPKMEEDPESYLKSSLSKSKKNNAIRLPGGYKTAPQTLSIIKSLESDFLDKIDFIGGHIGYGIHQVVNQKVKYISFIRTPEERIISDFKEHCKPGRYFYKELKQKGFEINNYLKLLLEHKMDNLMTRQIAGPFDFFLHERESVNKELFLKAKENIDSILFFDIEQFDDSVLFMKNHFGWKKRKYIIKNRSKSSEKRLNLNEVLLQKAICYDEKLYKEIKPITIKKRTFLQRILYR